jgi:UPF0716 family protein affecting phage T7 exclusion
MVSGGTVIVVAGIVVVLPGSTTVVAGTVVTEPRIVTVVVGEGAYCVIVVVAVDPHPPMTRAETVRRTRSANKERAFMTYPPI